MTKKLFAMLLAAVMLLGVLTACNSSNNGDWISYNEVLTQVVNGEDANETQGEETVKTDEKGDVVKTNGNKTTTVSRRTKVSSTTKGGAVMTGMQTRTTREGNKKIKYTLVEDKGADYKVKGNVSIAVDTTRPTDYEAMFDVMQEVYPNINFTFDFHTDSSNGSYTAYLSKKIATKTAANIMWDSAENLPVVLGYGWVKPITQYFKKDPEAKYVPANVTKDHTFYGDLYALPHQATFGATYINTDLFGKLSLKMPDLDWDLADYDAFYKKGAAGFSARNCVAVPFMFDTFIMEWAHYFAGADGKHLSEDFYNWDTGKYDLTYATKAVKQMREWRLIPGGEGWSMANTKSGGTNLLNQQLGVDSEHSVWWQGKALMSSGGTWSYPEMEERCNFKFEMWPTPNKNGNLQYHVDTCYVTSTTSDAQMPAVYQALRFMTFSTNGNLARLQMYEKSEKGKYALNARVYYPVSTNPTVLNKFNKLDVTTKADVYMLKNIPNSSRYDAFKLVPEINSITDQYITNTLAQVQEGSKDPGDLADPIVKANKALQTAKDEFKAQYNKAYKK